MFQIILAFLLGWATPAQPQANTNGTVITSNIAPSADTGGDTGHIPPGGPKN